MFRSILTVVLIVLLVAGCWMIYKRVNSDNGLGTGAVFVTNSGKDQATTYFGDRAQEEARPTPSHSDDPGTINTEPVPGYNANSGASTSTAPTPAINPQPLPPSPAPYAQGPITPQPYGSEQSAGSQQYGQPSGKPSSGRRYDQQGYDQQPYSAERSPISGGDTFGPNPPNGFAFAGDGKYELYRQGDLTYRMDTKTGASCILYATMEEWAKPLVYSHGCGSRGSTRRRSR
jgi:hypothetical protein